MNSYYVYILTNKTRTTVYIGVTNDLATRLDQHQNAAVKSFTKKYRLTKLVYCESFSDVSDAIAREKQLKGWRREKKNALIAAIIRNGRISAGSCFERGFGFWRSPGRWAGAVANGRSFDSAPQSLRFAQDDKDCGSAR